MPFTPEEIESKEFLVVLRGYDKEEVGSFLRAVAADVREIQEQAGAAPEVPIAEPFLEPEPIVAEPVSVPSAPAAIDPPFYRGHHRMPEGPCLDGTGRPSGRSERDSPVRDSPVVPRPG